MFFPGSVGVWASHPGVGLGHLYTSGQTSSFPDAQPTLSAEEMGARQDTQPAVVKARQERLGCPF